MASTRMHQREACDLLQVHPFVSILDEHWIAKCAQVAHVACDFL